MRETLVRIFDLPLDEKDPNYALFDAVNKGNLEALKAEINAGADINAKTSHDEYGLIHFAANRGNCEALAWLKENGCDIFAKSKKGSSGLHFSAENGHLLATQWCVKNGADFSDQGVNGSTVVHLAARNGHLELLEWLKENGCDIFAKTKKERSGLHFAASHGHLPIIQWYVKNGADLSDPDADGITVVHFAAGYGHLELLEWLKENGCDIFAKTKKGYSGLHAAALNGHLPVIQWYIEENDLFPLSMIIERFEAGGFGNIPSEAFRNVFCFILKKYSNCLLDAHKKLNIDLVGKTLDDMFLMGSIPFEIPQNSLWYECIKDLLNARLDFTKAYQNREFSTFLTVGKKPIYLEIFRADVESFLQAKNALLGEAIEELLGFLFEHYQHEGPRSLLAELGLQLHQHWMDATTNIDEVLLETNYHNLIISTLCILTQSLSNTDNQAMYCANLSALIGFKIKGKAIGITVSELRKNYPGEVHSILDELKQCYEQYIGRSLGCTESSFLDPQMVLVLKEELHQAQQKNQALEGELNEFHKRARDEEDDYKSLRTKKINANPEVGSSPVSAGLFSSRDRNEINPKNESTRRKREREEEARQFDDPQCTTKKRK